MQQALVAWPRLSTVLLIRVTYRFWVWAVLFVLVLRVLPLNELLEGIVKRHLPDYAGGVVLLFLGFFIDKIPDRFFSNASGWGACDWLLAKTIKAKGLTPEQPTFRNLRPQRVRGEVEAWRTSMRLFAEALLASRLGSAGPSDAARRVVPWIFAGGLLCAGVLLAPWAWPTLLAQLPMTSLQLGLAALTLWVLSSVVLGRLAARAVAPWIRSRCL